MGGWDPALHDHTLGPVFLLSGNLGNSKLKLRPAGYSKISQKIQGGEL